MFDQSLRNSILGFFLLILLFSPDADAQEADIPMPGFDTSTQLSGNAEGDFELKVRGYMENTFNCEWDRSQHQELLLNSTRARLNISGRPDRNFDFGIGIVGTLNSGAVEFDLTRYMPDDIKQNLIPEASEMFKQRIGNQIFLQEAFGTLYMPDFTLRIGRHKFYTGTGYAYNPIDIFNYKNPLDPTYEINGIDSVLGTIDLPRQTEIQMFMEFADRLSNSGYMLRLKTYVSGWDVALQYSQHTKERVNWEAFNSSEFRWRLLGIELAGELGGIGIHGEGGYVFIESEGDAGTLTNAGENHERYLIGMDHTFDFQLYVIAEYLRIGQGRTDSSAITLNDRIAYLSGDILSTNRDTVFAGATYPLTDLMDFSLYGIIACNDPSAIINPWLLYSIYPGVNMSFTVYVPVGDEQSQNGKSGTGGFVRLKFNF